MENSIEIVEKSANIEKSLIGNLTFTDLEKAMLELGQAKYRANQVWDAIYKQNIDSFAAIDNIPKDLRNSLDEKFIINPFAEYKYEKSIDGSIKFLFKLADGKAIESVYMPWIDGDDEVPSRATLCISSQAGCPVDCAFCATGKLGLLRNLEAGEIVGQIVQANKILGVNITNVVYMGMGEPLLNYNNVVKSLHIINHGKEPLVNRRKVTVSTSGIVKNIERLAEIDKPPKLAISLHATTDGTRDKLVPWNKKDNISKLMNAVEYYYRKTGMKVTYEYIPFDGLNDGEQDVKRLTKIAKRVPSRVNIIPFNDISFTSPQGFASELKATPKDSIATFASKLKANGVVVIVRDTFGEDIKAACGQLALADN